MFKFLVIFGLMSVSRFLKKKTKKSVVQCHWGYIFFIGLSEAVTQKIPFHGFASAFLVAAKPKGKEKVLNYGTWLFVINSLQFVP